MDIKKIIYSIDIFINSTLRHKYLSKKVGIVILFSYIFMLDNYQYNNTYLTCLKTVTYPKNIPTDF